MARPTAHRRQRTGLQQLLQAPQTPSERSPPSRAASRPQIPPSQPCSRSTHPAFWPCAPYEQARCEHRPEGVDSGAPRASPTAHQQGDSSETPDCRCQSRSAAIRAYARIKRRRRHSVESAGSLGCPEWAKAAPRRPSFAPSDRLGPWRRSFLPLSKATRTRSDLPLTQLLLPQLPSPSGTAAPGKRW